MELINVFANHSAPHAEYPMFDNIEAAVLYVAHIREIMRKHQPHGKIFCFGTGLSGAILGTLLMAKDPDIQYCPVNKQHEDNHRAAIGSTTRLTDARLRNPDTSTWFIDDDISSGRTLEYVLKYLDDNKEFYSALRNLQFTGIIAWTPAYKAEEIAQSKLPFDPKYFYH